MLILVNPDDSNAVRVQGHDPRPLRPDDQRERRRYRYAAIGYSGGIAGGFRAVEHLVQIAVEAQLVPLGASVIIPHAVEAFDAVGQPTSALTDISLRVALDDLAWWAATLKQARAVGQLQLAAFRVQSAAVALSTAAEDEIG